MIPNLCCDIVFFCLCSNVLTVSWILSRLAQIICWDKQNKLLDFADIDLIFKAPGLNITLRKKAYR